MPDKEKIVKGLSYCTHTDSMDCPNCPYYQEKDCIGVLNTDVLALLKKQEAQIRQLSLALDIVKGACEGIRV